MSRIGWILTGLLCVLLVLGWYLLLWSPTAEDIEQTRADTDSVLMQAQQQRHVAARLREVRQSAPEIEAQLAGAQVLIPEGTALPALFRQVQSAADDAAVTLTGLSPSRPVVVEDAPDELSSMQVNMTLEASFFQLVDFARRLEDPDLSGRGLLWRNASVSFNEDAFPQLDISLSAEVFARVDADALPEIEDDEPDDDGNGEDEDGVDDDAPTAPDLPDPGDDDEVL